MLEAKIEQLEYNKNNVEPKEPEYHYVGVMFESKYDSSINNPKFYGRVYEYKTKRDLKEGQVISFQTQYGVSRVCVVKPNILKEDLEYKEYDKIVEI